jgi:hypothetical protein
MITASQSLPQEQNLTLPDIPTTTLLDGICSDFELGCVDPVNTLSRLQKLGLLATPDHLATVFVAGLRALSQETR